MILWSVQGEGDLPYSFNDLFNNSYSNELTAELKSPSVKSFVRASTTGNSVKSFAVYLNLTNACQTLDDVSKVNTQVPKIALVTLVNDSTCTLQELAGNVQNAGYSVLIYIFKRRFRSNILPLRLAIQMLPHGIHCVFFNCFSVVTYSDILFLTVQSVSLYFHLGCSYQFFKTYS